MPINDIQSTNRQHAVPQNIMDVEFKIIGDLTMRQFSYLFVFGGIAYLTFLFVTIATVKYPLIIFFVLFGVCFAFVPYQERGLDVWLINFIRAIYKPTQRIWKKEPNLLSNLADQTFNVVRQELITLSPTTSRRKLEEFLHMSSASDTQDELDIPESEYSQKVHEAFVNYNTDQNSQDGELLSNAQSAPLHHSVDLTDNIKAEKSDSVSTNENKLSKNPKTQIVPTNKKELPKEEKTQQNPPKTPSTQKQQETPVVNNKPTIILPNNQDYSFRLKPMTPDQHSGRRFTNLMPSQGTLILPIRGERVLSTVEEDQIQEDIQEKAQQLKDLLNEIRQQEGLNPEGVELEEVSSDITTKTVQQDFQKTLDELQKENEDLSKQIQALKAELQNIKDPKERLKKTSDIKILEDQKSQKEKSYFSIKQKLIDLQERLFAKTENDSNLDMVQSKNKIIQETIHPAPKNKASSQKAQIKDEKVIKSEDDSQSEQQNQTPTEPKLTYNPYESMDKTAQIPNDATSPVFDSNIMPSPKTPNIISGMVKDQAGNPQQDLVILIKNNKGDPVRALKTNAVGQFSISTPLALGTYTLETDKSQKTSLSFDILKFEVNDQIIPPVEIKGVK